MTNKPSFTIDLSKFKRILTVNLPLGRYQGIDPGKLECDALFTAAMMAEACSIIWNLTKDDGDMHAFHLAVQVYRDLVPKAKAQLGWDDEECQNARMEGILAARLASDLAADMARIDGGNTTYVN